MKESSQECGLLSDIQILERIVSTDPERLIFVSPLVDPGAQIGPSSLDVRIATDFRTSHTFNTTHLDLTNQEKTEFKKALKKYMPRKVLTEEDCFVLHPNEFILGSTLEYFRLPRDIAGRIEGRSSLGRLGLQVHATAGFVDPGFDGTLTFKLSNCGRLPLKIPAGLRIGQISFFSTSEVQVGYSDRKSSKYRGQLSAMVTKIADDIVELNSDD